MMGDPSTTHVDQDRRRKCGALSRRAIRAWGRHVLGRGVRDDCAAGTETTGHHDYACGDELRYVDWSLCARHDELRTRQFQGREDHVVYLLIDCSPSMMVGRPPKFEVARQLAAALGEMVLAGGDALGVAAVSDRVVAELAPAPPRGQRTRLHNFLETLAIDNVATDLRRAAAAFAARRRDGQPTVLIGDLLDPERLPAALDLLRRGGHQPYLIHLFDRDDATPDFRGPRQLVDAETGALCHVDPTPADLLRHAEQFGMFRRRVRQLCRSRGVRFSEVRTDTPVHQSILRIIQTAAREGGVPT